MENKNFDALVSQALSLGAYKAAVVNVADIETDRVFRELCEKNVCGKFGRCYTCPPDVGDIDELIAKFKSFKYALVYQTVGMLEDSFDIEGMQDAAKKHCQLILELMKRYPDGVLHLGAGGCPLCERCAKATNEPCRHPEHAIASLEAHGVNVSELAKSCSMKYINGQNTVTYFAAMLFKENFNA
jgi:predicted metal-binding protein